MKAWSIALLVAAAFTGLGLVTSQPAEAAPCVHRGHSHIAQHGGLYADNAWHVSHGQPPSCDPGGDEPASNQRDDRDDDDRKSRYCRKRWFC